ncbi:MAG: hypothetical protein DRJ10_06145, partial [Bacteroidetes bacterium]
MKISKNAATYFTANLMTKFAAFFLIPVYTVFFTPTEYGILNIIQISASFVFIFYTLGLRGALTRFFFDHGYNSTGQKKLIGNILVFTFVVGFILSLTLTIFGNKISINFFKDVPFFPYLLIAVWTAFFRIFHQIKLTIFQIKQKAFYYTLLDSGFILSNIIFTIIIVAFLKKGITGKIYLDIILISIFAIISFISLLKDIKLNFDFKILKEPLKFSIPLIPHMLSGFLLSAIDRIFLEQIKDLHEVGLYSLAFNIAMILYIVIDAVRLSYTPYFNKKAITEGDKAKPEFAKNTTYGFAIYAILGIIVTLFSKELIILVT